VKRRGTVATGRVHVPEEQSPFFFVPGRRGGWFVALTWNFGAPVTVPWRELRRLIASSRGEIIIGRRLAPTELRMLEE